MFRGSIPALRVSMRMGASTTTRFVLSWGGRSVKDRPVSFPWGRPASRRPCRTTSTQRVVELCVEVAAGKVPVIAGAGSNSTREAVELATHAESAGADAVRWSRRY